MITFCVYASFNSNAVTLPHTLCKHPLRVFNHLRTLCSLFCSLVSSKPIRINNMRTLSRKQPGWGAPKSKIRRNWVLRSDFGLMAARPCGRKAVVFDLWQNRGLQLMGPRFMAQRTTLLADRPAKSAKATPKKTGPNGGESRERVFEAFRRWGYLQADLDPLGLLKPLQVPDLDLTGPAAGQARQIYCGTIGAEFMHLPESERRHWIAE